MSARVFAQILILGGLVAIVLACLTAALFVAGPEWLSLARETVETPVAVQRFTPVPTFTPTTIPSPLAPTFTPTLPPPSATPLPNPTATPPPTDVPPPTPAPTQEPTATSIPPSTQPPEPSSPPQSDIDFTVVQQRMRSNEENSVGGKIVNNCGADHTIYVTVLDAADNPLSDVIVGDTFDNVRAVAGSAGLGKLTIQLWSNTMTLVVQQGLDGTPYTSEQTLPLSTRDEDIPTVWLFEGGYCASMDECALRQQTNGLCRGHYSYDVTFQRTW